MSAQLLDALPGPTGVPPAALAWLGLLVTLLCAVCVFDVRSRRIPNGLVVVLLVAGLARAALADAAAPALASALAAVAIGLAVALPLYALRVMGAGDIKLFAASAAWLGAGALPRACWWTAIAGGALALLSVAMRHLPLRPAATPRAVSLPYGVAIAAGVLAAIALPTV